MSFSFLKPSSLTYSRLGRILKTIFETIKFSNPGSEIIYSKASIIMLFLSLQLVDPDFIAENNRSIFPPLWTCMSSKSRLFGFQTSSTCLTLAEVFFVLVFRALQSLITWEGWLKLNIIYYIINLRRILLNGFFFANLPPRTWVKHFGVFETDFVFIPAQSRMLPPNEKEKKKM